MSTVGGSPDTIESLEVCVGGAVSCESLPVLGKGEAVEES